MYLLLLIVRKLVYQPLLKLEGDPQSRNILKLMECQVVYIGLIIKRKMIHELPKMSHYPEPILSKWT